MNQTGNKLTTGHLQEFLDSARNAARLGQRQFFTPKGLAEVLCDPLPTIRPTALDLSCGSGHLLSASGAEHLFGLDIDSRSARKPRGADAGLWSMLQADLTRWYPLAAEVGLAADLILLNPPFSLEWYPERLAALAASRLEAVAGTYEAYRGKPAIDSTLASLLIALDLSSHQGEGFLVCNQATAARFLAEEGAHPALRRHLWAWLTIPGAVYEGQHTVFDTAVLYFAAGHQDGPTELRSASADPATVRATLLPLVRDRSILRKGRSITGSWASCETDLTRDWDALAEEYKRLHRGVGDGPNLSLAPDGTISVHLTTYQNRAVDRATVRALHAIRGRTPAALVVQQVSRAALKEAVTGGIWRVAPALLAAVEQAIAAYDAARAPFYTPNPVQALGWIDEETHITCNRDGLPGIRKGQRCTLATHIEDTTWRGAKVNLAGEREELEFHGRELVVAITAPDGSQHHFHARRDEDAPGDEAIHGQDQARRYHYAIPALLNHFEIPIPPDITQAHPELYRSHLATLDDLEARINSRLHPSQPHAA